MPIGTQDADALACKHGAVDVLHDDRGWRSGRGVVRRWVTKAYALHGKHWVGQVGWFLELETKVSVGQKGCNFLHPIQRFDTALRLLGFAGFGFKAVDKLLQMRNFVLLFGKCVLLQLHLLGTHVFELTVVAAVANQFGRINVQSDIGHCIQKFAVMTDNDHGSLVLLEPRL